MKTSFLPIKVVSVLLFSSTLVLPIAPSQASDPAVVSEAERLCIENAQSKGFELKEVVYSGASDVAGKDAKIILNLTRSGQIFKLTCQYHKASGTVAFGDEVAEVINNVDTSFPWWWALLPLIGLPLLLAWARNNDKAIAVAGGRGIEQYDAYIRGNGTDAVNVYANPSYNSNIIKTLYNGQQVKITDRDIHNQTGNWIELASGGWVPEQHVGTAARSK